MLYSALLYAFSTQGKIVGCFIHYALHTSYAKYALYVNKHVLNVLYALYALFILYTLYTLYAYIYFTCAHDL